VNINLECIAFREGKYHDAQDMIGAAVGYASVFSQMRRRRLSNLNQAVGLDLGNVGH